MKFLNFLKLQKQSSRGVLYKKGILRNFAKFTGKHLCQRVFFNKVAGLSPATLLRNSLARVFSCEFNEISLNTSFYRTPPVAASENLAHWTFLQIISYSLSIFCHDTNDIRANLHFEVHFLDFKISSL